MTHSPIAHFFLICFPKQQRQKKFLLNFCEIFRSFFSLLLKLKFFTLFFAFFSQISAQYSFDLHVVDRVRLFFHYFKTTERKKKRTKSEIFILNLKKNFERKKHFFLGKNSKKKTSFKDFFI